MTTVHHTPPPDAPPFAIYEDAEDFMPPSPSDAYDEDASFRSEVSLPRADEAIASIEHEQDPQDGPEPYRGSYTSRPSLLANSQARHVSGVTSTSFVSSLPSEISIASKPVPPANHEADTRHTPRKERPPFRNPASVRAMQMSSPTPLASHDQPRNQLKGTYKLAPPSNSGRSETSVSGTGSRQSGSRRESRRRDSHAQSPRPTPTPQQSLPLVLLHVTILPMQMPYSHDLMAKAMPHWLVENYKLLEEKLQDIVLMRRGLLIPHPRDEYDLLEERILESLELKTPRLLKCGHFVSPDSDSEDINDDDDDVASVTDGNAGRGSRMSGGTITVDEDGEYKYPTADSHEKGLCMDCHRQVQKPRQGVGSGTKRWDIKIYAANGLMRAGAWSAAWSEMERCDVEISPWVPDQVRKTLERRVKEEQDAEMRKQLYAAELQRRAEEDAVRLKKVAEETEANRKAEETELQRKLLAGAAALQKKTEEEATEKRLFNETVLAKIEEAKAAMRLEFEASALFESNSIAERICAVEEALKESRSIPQPTQTTEETPIAEEKVRSQSRGRARSSSSRPRKEEIPLSTLLRNYVLLLLRDQRNFLIIVLSVLVVFLSMNMRPDWSAQLAQWDLPGTKTTGKVLPELAPSVLVTTTAITTTTFYSTMTVTQLQSAAKSTPGSVAPSSIASIMAAPKPETSDMAEEVPVADASTGRQAMSSSVIVPFFMSASSLFDEPKSSVKPAVIDKSKDGSQLAETSNAPVTSAPPMYTPESDGLNNVIEEAPVPQQSPFDKLAPTFKPVSLLEPSDREFYDQDGTSPARSFTLESILQYCAAT